MSRNNKHNLTAFELNIIEKIKALLGVHLTIKKGREIEPFLIGFRGKKGAAIAAVEPSSVTDIYRLIQLLRELGVGYILQGANTALKGQGTPNPDGKPIVIIKTCKLKNIKILNYLGSEEYKILLVQPGISLKDAEKHLDKIGYDLPHKIGSHDFGNTFGASCATGCGGVRVDNRDGRASSTQTGNMGVVSISADGVIYNGFIRPEIITSGQDLLARIDANTIDEGDIELPKIDEINQFLKQLFINKSYPIRNHRGNIIFSGDGGEGSQAIIYQMYLIRKKPEKVSTYTLLFKDKDVKEHFYQDVIFSVGADMPDSLPILCESMNANLVHEIVKKGTGYASAVFLASAPAALTQYSNRLLSLRNTLICYLGSVYIITESFIGKILSWIFTPKLIRKTHFTEMLLLQMADRIDSEKNIENFEVKLDAFISKYKARVMKLTLPENSFLEKLMLEIRTTGALATLTVSIREKATLFAFDDAIMPGKMTNDYCQLLLQRLTDRFPGRVLPPYFYGHDLKQISHNDWILKQICTRQEVLNAHHIQYQTMNDIGGIAHAEHGVGDYADTDLNRDELVKLIAHRLLNDVKGIANPGGGWEKAFQKAMLDMRIVIDGIDLAEKALRRELSQRTLLTWSNKQDDSIIEKLNYDSAALLALTQ